MDGKRGDVDVEEALVGAVRRFTRPEGRWAEFEIPAVEGLGGTSEDVTGVVLPWGLVRRISKGPRLRTEALATRSEEEELWTSTEAKTRSPGL